MGGTSYSYSSRVLRSASAGYKTKSVADIFEQSKVQEIHESMIPSKALLREARDSATHPHTVPIILALDVTGSMGRIPHHLVKEGLPTMMTTIIQRGIADPALLFLAVGDSTCDRYPLQVSQFESGDAELDMWLTRTFLEGKGGGNQGESYLWAWYYAAYHTVTDAWDKRKEKGFLFTIGDEPGLRTITPRESSEVMKLDKQTMSDKELLAAAEEKWNVYHIHIAETSSGRKPETIGYWKDLLGQRCITLEDHTKVDKTIAEIVADSAGYAVSAAPKTSPTTPEIPYL